MSNDKYYEKAKISIHAPAWGATCGDLIVGIVGSLFQSTHPRGVRRGARFQSLQGANFNPRTRVGCDPVE